MPLTAPLIRPLVRPLVRGLAGGSGLDPDAAAFLAATGATNREGVDGFVKGLKLTNDWSKAVALLPMRSAQNYGTGTAVQCLKTGNSATLVNGPTWGADAISFTGGSAQYLTMAQTLNVAGLSAVYVGTIEATSPRTYDRLISMRGATGEDYQAPNIVFLCRDNAQPKVIASYDSGAYGSSSVTYGTPFFAMIDYSPGEVAVTVNGVTTAGSVSGANLDLTTLYVAAGYTGGGVSEYATAKVAFVGLFDTGVNRGDLRALYKSTLGAGLGLP